MKIRLLFLAAIVAASLFSLSARASCSLTDVYPSQTETFADRTETITLYKFDCDGVNYWVRVTVSEWTNGSVSWTASETAANGNIYYSSGTGQPGSSAPWHVLEVDNEPTGDPRNPPGS